MGAEVAESGSAHELPSRWAMWAGVATVAVFTLLPFAEFLVANQAMLSGPLALAPYALWVLAPGLAVVAVTWWLRRAYVPRVALVVAAVVSSFFRFHLLFVPFPAETRAAVLSVALWTLLTAALATLVWLVSVHRGVQRFVLYFGTIFLGILAVNYGLWAVLTDRTPVTEVTLSEAPRQVPALEVEQWVDTPNIYMFLLDSYGREDVLSDLMDFDNTAFSQALADRGFEVSPASYAPYNMTQLTVPAVMSMDYLATDETGLPGGLGSFNEIFTANSPVIEELSDRGYQYVYSPVGFLDWTACNPAIVDLCIPAPRQRWPYTEVGREILGLTPLSAVVDKEFTRSDPAQVVDWLESNEDELNPPFFVYSHILIPHWPPRFDDDCEIRGDNVAPVYPPTDQDIDAYVTDVGCLNDRLLDAIDRIVDQDPDAVILLLGDHGSRMFHLNRAPFDDYTPDQIRDSFANLEALKLPLGCITPGPEPNSSVNLFRYVFACLAGTEVEPIDGRAFLWPEQGTEIYEVPDPDVLFADNE